MHVHLFAVGVENETGEIAEFVLEETFLAGFETVLGGVPASKYPFYLEECCVVSKIPVTLVLNLGSVLLLLTRRVV